MSPARRQHSIEPKYACGFEPTVSAGERLQTYTLDRAATGTGNICENCDKILGKLSGNTPPFEFEPAVVFTLVFNIK